MSADPKPPGDAGRERRRLRRAFYRRRVEQSACASPPQVSPGFLASVELATRMMQREITQLRDLVSRQKADFDNVRRRHEREKEQIIATASESVVTRLLPVLDNFERALASDAVKDAHPSLCEGLGMILDQVNALLVEEGVERIDALNSPFDPTVHDAVSTVQTDEVPDHHVARVLVPGYRLKDRVIRPAVVIVAVAPPDPSGAAPSGK
jgi:molecular chaperone GrpE